MQRVPRVRQLRRLKQRRTRSAARRRETNRWPRVQGEVQPAARNERAIRRISANPKLFLYVESPLGLDPVARRKRRNDRAFHRRGKDMGFADEPVPGRLACRRGGFRHGLLGGGPERHDCANHGRSALGAHPAAGASRWNGRQTAGLDRHHGARCASPLRLRRTTGENSPRRTAEKPGSCNSKIPCKKFGQSRSKQ